MDIYDDFDPQQYDYDDSDQEDDIVYLEGPVQQGEDPFLPYLAKDVDLSQTQMSQPQQQAPNLLPRRERQRRREEQMMQEEESSDSEQSNHPHEGEEDVFASLQSLLEKQSQREKEKKAALNQDESVAGEAIERTALSIAANEQEHEAPAQNAKGNVIHETQSQFPAAEDWEPSQQDLTQETKRNAVPMLSHTAVEHTMSMDGPSISSGLMKELYRANKKRDITSQSSVLMDPPRAVDLNLLSELEKSRKRAAQEKTTSRPKKRTSDGTLRSNRIQSHQNTQLKTHVAKDSKSIVGSR
jgi:hypothetical protein